MSFVDKQLLVTGASGHLGKAVVAELRRLGAKNVIAATRTPGKNPELAALGVEEREADFDRPETLQTAFRGVERLLLVSTDSLHAPGLRVKQHRAAVQAREERRCRAHLYTSIPNARPTVGHSIPDDHFWTEAAIYESGLDWTILRNNLYAEVVLRFAQFAFKTGKLVSATNSQGSLVCDSRRLRKNGSSNAAQRHRQAHLRCDGSCFGHTRRACEHTFACVRESHSSCERYGGTRWKRAWRQPVIPLFAARSVRELDEEASYGYQAMVTPTVKDLTGRAPHFGRGLSPGDSARIDHLT